MSLADIMTLQALFGLAVVVFEFPSGYLADRIGRRRSLLVGGTLAIAGWLAYTRATTFASVAVAEMLLGAGSAFISGADRAMLWTSLGESGRLREYPRWEGRLRAGAQISEAVSSAVGGWLYALSPGCRSGCRSRPRSPGWRRSSPCASSRRPRPRRRTRTCAARCT